MRVVKDLMKPSFGRPYFACSDKTNTCSFWALGDVRPIPKPECRHGFQCVIRKVKKEVRSQQGSFILLLWSGRFMQILRMGG